MWFFFNFADLNVTHFGRIQPIAFSFLLSAEVRRAGRGVTWCFQQSQCPGNLHPPPLPRRGHLTRATALATPNPSPISLEVWARMEEKRLPGGEEHPQTPTQHPQTPSQRSPASTPALSSPSLTALNAHSFLQDSIAPLQPQGSGHVHRFLCETEQQAHPALFITLTQVLEEFICQKKNNNYINKYRPLAKLLLLPAAADGPGELKAHHRQCVLLGREEGT